jgi:hypothetical protein
MSTYKAETQEHELPSEQSHLAILKDLFSEGKFAEFWRHLGFPSRKVAQLESDLSDLESEVPQRHKWSHSSTHVMAEESTRTPEPSVDVHRAGSDYSA